MKHSFRRRLFAAMLLASLLPLLLCTVLMRLPACGCRTRRGRIWGSSLPFCARA